MKTEINGDTIRFIKERTSSKQKNFVADLLDRSFALAALDSAADAGDEKEFKEAYGLTIAEAQQAIDRVVLLLRK